MTPAPPALDARIMAALADAEPALPFAKLRERCRVRAATLSQRLAAPAGATHLSWPGDGLRRRGGGLADRWAGLRALGPVPVIASAPHLRSHDALGGPHALERSLSNGPSGRDEQPAAERRDESVSARDLERLECRFNTTVAPRIMTGCLNDSSIFSRTWASGRSRASHEAWAMPWCQPSSTMRS